MADATHLQQHCRSERRSRRLRAAARDIEARSRDARRVDDIFTPGDFDTRPRPARVHAAGPAPVRWDPRAGRFTRELAATARAHPLGWGLVALLFAMAAFAIAGQAFAA